jgi:hypothetical protein
MGTRSEHSVSIPSSEGEAVAIQPLDLRKLTVYPLAQRTSLTRADEILINPAATPQSCSERNQELIERCASRIMEAKQRGASIMLIYGAHLLRNGAARILDQMMGSGWLTHLATNGAGTIHDWEYAWFGASTESVEMGVAGGHFGTWHETATHIHMAMMVGALSGLGYGQSLGKLISEDQLQIPTVEELLNLITHEPRHPLTGARFDLMQAIESQKWSTGVYSLHHPWKHASILASAFNHHVPLTVHPGIGYDIISNHSVFSGSAIGRAAEWDFKLFGGSLDQLDGGVVLSVGSAIMGPQVFEKSISCVNNIRKSEGRDVVRDHSIFVVDLQDGGSWDWTQGEPPKSNPAYYLRFCKSYSRMGGAMHYLQCDNATFIHRLYQQLL